MSTVTTPTTAENHTLSTDDEVTATSLTHHLAVTSGDGEPNVFVHEFEGVFDVEENTYLAVDSDAAGTWEWAFDDGYYAGQTYSVPAASDSNVELVFMLSGRLPVPASPQRVREALPDHAPEIPSLSARDSGGIQTTTPERDLASAAPEAAQEILEEHRTLNGAFSEISSEDTLMADIEDARESLPTTHTVREDDARVLSSVPDESTELVVTSPPYFDIKEYGSESDGQLGALDEYDEFCGLLRDAWGACYDALTPGGWMAVVVGDVLRSRSEHGRHHVLPLHADIMQQARDAGFDVLAPVIWSKIGNMNSEEGGGNAILGTCNQPMSPIKTDVEYVLLFRKPGDYRSAGDAARILSTLNPEQDDDWSTQVWDDINGTSDPDHPAPYPAALAERLIQMFSHVGDTVLDPFAGSGTTGVAAARVGRDSHLVDVEPGYVSEIRRRLQEENTSFGGNFGQLTIQ